MLRKVRAALFSVIAGSAAISNVVAAAGEFWTARGLGQAGGSISYYKGAKNIYDPKIPKLQEFAIALLAKAHRLFRFLVGGHYGKGKSITDDR
jgi:hypothetical protein